MPRKLFYAITIGLVVGTIVLSGRVTPQPDVVQAQGEASLCYAVADEGDALWQIDPVAATSALVGVLGGTYENVEAMAISLDAQTLYAVHDDAINGLWGTIDATNGAFTEVGPVGPGNGIDPVTGLATTDPLNDVDGLSIHPMTGEMWGTTQDSTENKVFRINIATGRVVPDTFGPGLDYAQIVLPNPPIDIDDLAIDPTTGRFYAIANSGGTNDRLYELFIDGFDPPNSPGLNATLGTMAASEIGPLTFGVIDIIDMEGFTFFNDGTFFGTTGGAGGAYSDRIWEIDPATGQLSTILPGEIDADGADPTYGDFEAVECLTAGLNLKSGVVFSDLDQNGVLDPGESAYPGATVNFFRDNGNNTYDGSPVDQLVQSATTDGGGAYRFEVATEETYFAVVDPSTLPAGVALTTTGNYTVNFVDYDNTLINNNFGFAIPESEEPTATPTPTVTPTGIPATPVTPTPALTVADPALVKLGNPANALPGEAVTFTITASNTTTTPLTNVIITDAIDGSFFEAVLEASTTKGTVTIVNDLLITVTIGDIAPGEVVTITLLTRVRSDITGPDSTRNTAIMGSNERAPISAYADVSLVTLPNTGYPPVRSESAEVPTKTLVAAILGVTLLGIVAGIALKRRAA